MHIYIHDSDSPQNLVMSKGSLLLPMHLSNRLLVAHKFQELKKKTDDSQFGNYRIDIKGASGLKKTPRQGGTRI